jgi:hypothetical protein
VKAGAVEAPLRFIDALEQAYDGIGRHPVTGPPRYGHDLNLPGLRSWPPGATRISSSVSSAAITSTSGRRCTPLHLPVI